MKIDLNEFENVSLALDTEPTTGGSFSVEASIGVNVKEYYEGNSKYFRFDTDAFKKNLELNDVDKQIASRFLFTKKMEIFIKNPADNTCMKVSQGKDKSPIKEWLIANLPHDLKQLLITSLKYGADETIDSDMWTVAQLKNSMDVYQQKFPLMFRQAAAAVCYNGENKVTMRKKEEGGPLYYCHGHVTLDIGKLDFYDCIVNNIFFYKTDSNTINIMDVKGYSNDKNELAINKFALMDVEPSNERGFVTNWLAQRMDEPSIDVLKAWIWGVYDSKNQTRQILWLYDPNGFAGKSVFLEAAFKSLEQQELIHTVQAKSIGNQFEASSFYDKRLLIIADNKDANVVRYGMVHMITGHDPVHVEEKGQMAFTFRPNLKMIIGSNCTPALDLSARHEYSRMIVINWKLNKETEMAMAIKDENGNPKRTPNGQLILAGDDSLKDKLEAAMPQFLAECKAAYDKLCVNNDTIDASSIINTLFNIATSKEEIYDEFFDTYFIVSDDPNEYITKNELIDTWITWCSDEANRLRIQDADLSDRSADLLTHLRKRGVTTIRTTSDGKRLYKVPGVRTKGGTTLPPQVGEPLDLCAEDLFM